MEKRVSKILKKEFDSKLVYNKKYLKNKIKSYNGKINTDFHNNKIPKEESTCIGYKDAKKLDLYAYCFHK